MYSVSIPLGATINMDGAAVTITVFTLAMAHTLGIKVDFATALILSVYQRLLLVVLPVLPVEVYY